MDDGGDLRRLEADEMATDRLAHAYAVTVHRSQGSTVQRAHALEDGGGRELAYVKMSRAKDRSTVYVVADDAEQAREDLVREWSAERRPAWVIDSGTPASDPAAVEASERVAQPMRGALRRGRLVTERAAIAAVIPPDPSAEIAATEKEVARLRRQRDELAAGTGHYADGPVGHALWELRQAEINVARLKRDLDRSDASRRDRRRSRTELGEWQERQRAASRAVATTAAPEAARLDAEEDRLTGRLPGLWEQQAKHRDWVAEHPGAARRLGDLAGEIEALDARLQHGRDVPTPGMGLGRPGSWPPPPVARERDLGIDLGL
jgi:hypothetical protein